MALLRRCTDGLGLLRRGLAPDAFPTAARALVQGCRPCDVPQICSGCAETSIKETAVITFDGLTACEGCITHPPQGSWELPSTAVLSGMWELPQLLDDDGDFTCVYKRTFEIGTESPFWPVKFHVSNFNCSSVFPGAPNRITMTMDIAAGGVFLLVTIQGSTFGATLFQGSAAFSGSPPTDCAQQVVIDNEINNCDPRHFTGGLNLGGTATVDFV